MFATNTYRASDPDEYSSLIRGARVEVILAQRGAFDAQVTRVDLDNLWMQRGHESLARTFRGVTPANRVIFWFLASPQPAATILSSEIGSNQLALLAPALAGGWRSTAPCDWASMSLPTDDFRRYGSSLAGRDVMPREIQQVLQPSDSALSRLRRLHQAAIDLAASVPDLASRPEVTRGLQHHLIEAAFAAAGRGEDLGSVRGYHRQRIMARFEALIEANPDRALYLAEVCDAVGATERTFRMCCQQTLGMSPTRYLWLRRMHLVHRALALGDPATETVTDIATSHGFWELGRFSVTYRTLFGEQPSATLRQPPHTPRMP
jgi:AraC-like DNA-binding protein